MMRDLQLEDYENLRYLIRKLTKLGFIDKSEREYTAKNSTRVYFKLTDKANKMFSMEYDDFDEEELEDEDLEMVRLFEVKKEQTQEQKNLDAIANTFGNDEAVVSKFKEWTDVARDSLLNRDRPVRIPKLSTKTFLENAIIKKAIRELLQCTPQEQLELLDFCINKKYGTISKDMLSSNKNYNYTYNNVFQKTEYKGDYLMIDFKYNADNPCESCPFPCGENKSICSRLFYFMQALKVSNLNPEECTPFRPTLDKYNKEPMLRLQNISDNIIEFVDEGNNLFINGPTGVGKTAFSIKIMLNYLNYICKHNLKSKVCRNDPEDLARLLPCIYIVRSHDIANTMWDFDKYLELRENVSNAYIVLFDDVCTKKMTPALSDRILELINIRMSSNKTSIYTSNLTGSDFKNGVDGRIVSRMKYKLTQINFDEKCIDRRAQEVSKW